MSLISLKSVKNYQGVEDSSANPSFYTSSFREGLPIKKGQSVQLISFSMNMNGEIIVNTLNNTFYIKQGRDPFTATNNQTRYLVKKIVIPSGAYTKNSLKSALQTAIRGMVIIPDFNNWSVIEKADSNGELVFSIQHTRQLYDIFTDYQDNNYSVFDLYNVNGIVSSPTTSNVVVSGNNTADAEFSVNKVADADLANNYVSSLRFNYLHALMKSERGIFGEGGRVSVIVPKVYIIDDYVFSTSDNNEDWNFTTIGLTKPAGAGASTPDNATNFNSAIFNNPDAKIRGNLFSMSPPATFSFGLIKDLGLDYSVSGGGTNVPSWFDNAHQEQYIFMLNTTSLGVIPTPTLDFTTLGCVMRIDKLTEQSFLNSSQTTGALWENFTGFSDINCAGNGTETAFFRPQAIPLAKFKSAITTKFYMYGRCSLGLAQDVLANKPRSLTQFGVENTFTKVALNNSGGAGGTLGTGTSVNQYSDWAFEFLDLNSTTASLAFKYNQITGTPSSTNWRTTNNRKSTIDPSAVWTDFVYGTSNIKLEFIVNVIGNISFNASHDTDGTKATFSQVFSEKTTYGNNPVGSLGVDSQLREVKYPLTPMISFAPHNFLQARPEVAGYYADLKRNAQDLTDGGYISAPLLTTTEFNNTSNLLGATQKANTTKFTMNFVPASQIVSGKEPSADEILDRDIVNATMGLQNDATAGKSIGYVEPIYTQDPTGSPPPTQSLDGLEIQYNNTTPNIIVEIPELKTQSYNSVNQEKNNAIAFLPSVEFATNQDTGFIHHQSQYDIESDINVPNDIVINQLTAKITDDNGRILSTQLSHPTEMVIQIKDTQRSLMIEQANMINDKMGLERQVNQDRKFNNMPNYTEM